MKLAPNINKLFFKKIFSSPPAKTFSLWQRTNAELFVFSRGTHGLIFLVEYFFKKYNRMPIMAFPDLFCRGTIDALEKIGVKIISYPIDEQLTFNFNELALDKKPDFFLVTNFFGSQKLPDNLKKSCKKLDILLIEDCAHLLYTKESSTEADITFYTPYKFFPIPDGAIFQIERKVLKKLDIKENNSEVILPEINDFKWLCKKILSRFTPSNIYKRLIKNDLSFDHEFDGEIVPRVLPMNGLSRFFLSRLTEADLMSMISKRKLNLEIMEGAAQLIIDQKYEIKSSPLGVSWNLALVFKSTVEAKKAFYSLSEQGLLVQSWPDIKPGWGSGLWQDKKIIILPIHQDLNFSNWMIKQTKELVLKKITNNMDLLRIQNKLVHHNLLQSSFYGEIKEELESKMVFRYLVCYKNKDVGYLQVLKKTIGPFKIYRINRGPVYFFRENSFIDFLGIHSIRRTLKQEGMGVLIWNPDLRKNVEIRSNIKKCKYFLFKESETHTVWIDLKQEVEQLRKNLKINWRNHLVKSEKNALKLKVITDSIDEQLLIHDYSEQQKRNAYSGLPAELVSKLIKTSNEVNRTWLFQAFSEDECVSQILISLHGQSATYLIGINLELGRKLSANYFLLWQAILVLKQHGIESLDLGGLGITRTPSIASFKLGMGGDEFYFAGEYLGIIF